MHLFLLLPPLPNKTVHPAAPVGLAYLAAILKANGTRVSALSSDAVGKDVHQTVDQIVNARPDALGISIATPAYNNTIRIVQGVRKALASVLIVAGGPHATLFPDDLLQNGFDVVVRGEGERTLIDLIEYMTGKHDLADIDGISYQKNDRPIHNPNRKLIKKLDEIPFPAWEFFPIKSYESPFKKSKFSVPVVTSRGCPGKCTYCYKEIFGTRFRVRSPENILREIVYLRDKFGVDEFSIIDDSFTSIPKRAIEFCRLMISNHINLPWSLPAGVRVDTVSEELMWSLKEAGCYRAGFGIETGNPGIMKSIKKGITIEQVENAVALAKKVGIECTGYFMIGNIEETLGTINDTIKLALKLDPDYAQFTRATPYPGSEMYRTLMAEDRIISKNWDDYDSFLTDRNIFRHKNLSSAEIQKKLKAAYRRFYFRPRFIFRELRKKLSADGLRKLIKSIPFVIKQLLK